MLSHLEVLKYNLRDRVLWKDESPSLKTMIWQPQKNIKSEFDTSQFIDRLSSEFKSWTENIKKT